MSPEPLTLSILPDIFAICRLDREAQIPAWACEGSFTSITRTPDELSIVCSQGGVPAEVKCEKGWRCLKVEGPLDFALTGILASLATPLAQTGISILALSTYDTDYLLVREEDMERAMRVLSREGAQVRKERKNGAHA